MFWEHGVLHHNNLLCLFCFGRHSCPLESDTLEERLKQQNGKECQGNIFVLRGQTLPITADLY